MKHNRGSFAAFFGMFLIVLAVTAFIPALTQGQKSEAAPQPPILDVKVINTTSEPVPISGTVSVGNLGTNPLPVRDVNVPRRTPVQIKVLTYIFFGEAFGEQDAYTVPPGQRLVIEHIAVSSDQLNPGNAIQASISCRSGSQIFAHPVDFRSQAARGLGGGPLFVANHPMSALSDPGQAVTVRVALNEVHGSGGGFFLALSGTLSGYVEEVLP